MRLSKSVLVMILILELLLVMGSLPMRGYGTPPWLRPGWAYRKSHVIAQAPGAGTNYQVNVTVHYGAGSDSANHIYVDGKSQVDFDDIRFTSSDGTTLLDYYPYEVHNSDNATFFVEIPGNLTASSQTIYVYYNNTDAISIGDLQSTFINGSDSFDRRLNVYQGDYGAFSAVERIRGGLKDGRIVHIFRDGSDHVSLDGTLYLSYSNDKYGDSWTSPVVFMSDENYDVQPGCILTQISGGILIATYGLYNVTSGLYEYWKVIKSSDYGDTWGDPIDIPMGIWEYGQFGFGEIIELYTGLLLMPMYAREPGGDDYCFLLSSDDQGDSWEYYAEIYNAFSYGTDLQEPTITRCPNGSLICIMRVYGGDLSLYIQKAYSDTNGLTWYGLSDCDEIRLAGGMEILTLNNDHLMLIGRDYIDPFGLASYYSTDNGASWSSEYFIHAFSGPDPSNMGHPSSFQYENDFIFTVYYDNDLNYDIQKVIYEEGYDEAQTLLDIGNAWLEDTDIGRVWEDNLNITSPDGGNYQDDLNHSVSISEEGYVLEVSFNMSQIGRFYFLYYGEVNDRYCGFQIGDDVGYDISYLNSSGWVDSGQDYSLDTWHKLRMIYEKDNATIAYFVDDLYINTVSPYASSVHNHVKFGSFSTTGDICLFDNLIIRKWSADPPGHGIWGAEEQVIYAPIELPWHWFMPLFGAVGFILLIFSPYYMVKKAKSQDLDGLMWGLVVFFLGFGMIIGWLFS